MDENLRWEGHMFYVSGKVRYLIYTHTFYQLTNIFSKHDMECVYHDLLLSYEIVMWGITYSSNLNELVDIQFKSNDGLK